MTSVPELWGIPVAVLALIVAGAGFLISLSALGWQIAKHFFDGGRVRVYLNVATWEPNHSLGVHRSGRWGINRTAKARAHTVPESMEVAQLVVENPGRTAVTVYSPALASSRLRRRFSYVPRMFKLDGYGSDNATTETSVRIEPYDRVTFLLDFWSVVPTLRKSLGGRAITLRGQVNVAGAVWPRKSSWRRAWRIKRGDWTAYRDATEISPRTVIWRAFYIHAHLPGVNTDDDGDFSKSVQGHIVLEAMQKFQEQPSREEFKAAVEEVARDTFSIKYPIYGMAVWHAYEELAKHRAHLSPWTPPSAMKKDEPDVGEEAQEEVEVDAGGEGS